MTSRKEMRRVGAKENKAHTGNKEKKDTGIARKLTVKKDNEWKRELERTESLTTEKFVSIDGEREEEEKTMKRL